MARFSRIVRLGLIALALAWALPRAVGQEARAKALIEGGKEGRAAGAGRPILGAAE